MALQLDPIVTSAAISSDYRRYLNSLLPLRDGPLATALTNCINETKLLTKGPYLEATPPYSTGASLQTLIDGGVLPKAVARFDSKELPLNRPLYRHQELATRKVREGRNVVVSTGTGSGKTESFLIPIIAELAAEIEAGTLGPGVRAILLYPMNALANDQVKRLRRLLSKTPEVTFGRYVGDTPHEKRKGEEQFAQLHPDETRLPNEFLSREEMQAAPPNILLTNYAMLEYLLLRPKDMDLFEGKHAGHWKFLVVDEAHVYDGARGSELAMLLRRLRNRVNADGDLRCIATSATVGAESSPAAVTTFASNLFGTEFEYEASDPGRQDLVLAEKHTIARPKWGPLTGSDYAEIATADDLDNAIMSKVPLGIEFSGAADALASEESMVTVRTMLSKRVATLTAITERLGNEWTTPELVHLVTAGGRTLSNSGVPVMSGRYHQWVRATEGAFTCLNSTEPHVTLARTEECDTCERPVFELASCTRCGTAYVLGQETPQKGLPPQLAPRTGQRDERTWVALTDTDGVADEDDDSWGDEAAEVKDAVELCTDCGTINSQDSTTCAKCTGKFLRSARIAASRQSNPRGCIACESRSENDVRLLDTGQDASTAVVATSLYQNLPPDAGSAVDLPGAGRKVLIFNDSRQGAAFFAPYLENTYQRILQRRLLLRAIQVAGAKEGGAALLEDVIAQAREEATDFALFKQRASRQTKEREIGLWLAQELVALDERQSLEGLGLVRLEIDAPEHIAKLPVWETLGLTGEEGVGLVTELLRIVRRQGAMSMPDGVDAADESFKPRLGPVYIRESVADIKLLAWSPAPNKNNKRIDYITRVLARTSSSASAADVLAGIWRVLTTGADPLLVSRNHQKYGPVRQVDFTWLKARALDEGDTIYRCSACKRWAPISVAGACPGYRCAGDLQEVKVGSRDEDTNHYRSLYRDLTPIPMSVEEHTAQWRATEAAEIQNKFVQGEINALSCSTTFELGVDVGELQAVLLKNVPPRTANYVQRAGRAGRRTASAALVVTMAQRRSHDLTQFAEPEKMISGEVTAPIIPLGNARIDRRHAHSIVLSSFFRKMWVESGLIWRKSGEFFYPPNGAPDPLELLPAFLSENDTDLTAQIRSTLPASVLSELKLDAGGWRDDLLELLRNVRAEVNQDIGHFEDARTAAHAERKDNVAAMYGRVIRTLETRDLLGFLGSRNILPKYGFPSDVVDLKTSITAQIQGARLDLSRDLTGAIYEFAPGAEIVAGGLKWTSAGVYRLPGKELISGWISECGECGHFESSLAPLEMTCPECAADRRVNEYSIPEFGFVADRNPTKPGLKPPIRSWNGATHFVGKGVTQGEPIQSAIVGGVNWERQAQERATMVAVSTGARNAGFALCDWCGRGWSRALGGFPKSHNHAWKDEKCTGPTQHRYLAHEFQTDVVTISVGAHDSHSISALWSTLYALLEGAAEHLQISRDDIDGTIAFSKSGVRLVLFDTVPGGAGGALRISEHFETVAKRALSMVSDCECGKETSCYSCLRSYRNQMRHELLARGSAVETLAQLTFSN